MSNIIKQPIMIFIILFTFITITILSINYKYYSEKKEQYIQSRVNLVQEHYNVTYQTFKINSKHFYNSIVNNKKILKILKNANSDNKITKDKAREELKKIFNNKYQLIANLGIDLIQFHLPNNESFFRRFEPSSYGDNLTSIRFTIEQTNKNKIEHEGLEVGKHSHAFRFVFPVFDDKQNHIGSLEGSVSSLAFLKYLERSLRIHTHFIIKKDAVDMVNKKLIKNYLKTNGLKNSLRLTTDAKNDKFHTKDEKRQIKAKLKDMDTNVKTPFVITVIKNNKVEIVTFIPILNVKDKKTIAYIVAYDENNDLTSMDDEYYKTVILSILFSLLLSYLIYKILIAKNNLQKEVDEKTKELKSLNNNLEETIEDKTKELKNTLDMLSKYVMYSKTDLSGTIVEVSDAFCKTTLYKKEELLGSAHNIIKHQDNNDELFKTIWETIQEEKVWDGEIKNNKKDDTYYWVHAHISPDIDTKGNTVGYIAIMHDITANKDFEKQHLQLLKSEKLASMGEMIGNIAHQWRQPLSVITTSATSMIVQKECNILSDENFINTCELINQNGQYLSKTIDDFKNFIKGDREKITFSLEKTIDSLSHLIEGVLKSSHIKLVLNIKDNISVNGYENELIQCLINIINNSKDAMNSNELIQDKFIFISTNIVDEKDVVITIRDNAGGIPEDVLPKIFEPYFTTKHKSKGTGLGLHMTYNLIVKGMDGTVKANNVTYRYKDTEYIGAEFVINLPFN